MLFSDFQSAYLCRTYCSRDLDGFNIFDCLFHQISIGFQIGIIIEGKQRGYAESRWVADMGVREQVIEDRPSYDRDTGAYTGTSTYERPYEEAPGISPLLVAELLDHSIFFSLGDLAIDRFFYSRKIRLYRIHPSFKLPLSMQKEYDGYIKKCTDGEDAWIGRFVLLTYGLSSEELKETCGRLEFRRTHKAKILAGAKDDCGSFKDKCYKKFKKN